MFTISKQFTFSASHVLSHLPEDHPCARMHGHNYVVELVFKSPCLDARGFCQVDYGELAAFEAWLLATVDHRHLNAVMGEVYPTAELLAKFFFKKAREVLAGDVGAYLTSVRVSETPRTWAAYES
jgi:6-pyruvoyltetrahydropterin/6-carboxytetrahydropterin synthase